MNEKQKLQRPKLGEWRTITAKVVRKVKYIPHGRDPKTWERQPLDKPIPGMFIGSRTGSNGTRDWEGDEVGYTYYPEQAVELWLFVDNPRRKPFYVFPDDAHFEEIEAQS